MTAAVVAPSAGVADSSPAARRYEGKRVVVTGALGFVGDRIVRALGAVDCDLVRVARRAGPARDSAARITEVIGDVREPNTWARALDGADYVFHLAAQTGAAAADADRRADHDANVMPMLHLVGACRAMTRAPVVVFAGSVTQAGLVNPSPGGASDRPQTVYDEHKLEAERVLERCAREGVVKGVTLRLSNVYGPGPRAASAERGVLNAMIAKALRGEALPVFGGGAFLRDYLHVEDAARAFVCAGGAIEALHAGHYVVASGRSHSIAEAFHCVAARVTARTGRAVRVDYVEPPSPLSPLQERSFVADPAPFNAAAGWRAEWSLAAGIDHTIEEMLCESW